MKRVEARAYVIGVLLILLLWGGLTVFNQQQDALYYGDVLLQKETDHVHRLDGWQEKADGFHVEIQVEDPKREYALLFAEVSGSDTLFCNVQRIQGTGHFYIVASLPEIKEGGSYHIVMETLGGYSCFIAESNVIEQRLFMQKLANCAMITLMIIMPIYTLSLFLFKKNESYLLYFFSYQSVFLVWGLIRLSPGWNELFPWWTKISYGFVWIISLISLKYCMDAAEVPLSQQQKRWTSWRNVGLFALVTGVIMYYLKDIRHWMNVSVYSLCVIVTANAMTRKIKGAGWLFAGSVLRAGLAPIIYLSTFRGMLGQECFIYFLLHRTYFIDLPFLLGGMMFINQKFAHQFSESERLAAHLDELVAVRTRELEIAQAERQSMILNITHDLRTPLFVIKNCLGVVENDPQALPDMLPVLQQRSEFVSSLTEDLFLLVKLQEGKMMLNQQRENLSELLSELCSTVVLQAGEKKISFTQSLLADVYVWGDGVRLQQIFQNLIANAFHYTPEGGEISVRMELLPAEEGVGTGQFSGSADQIMSAEEISGWVRVAVRDSGKGISPADAEHIFDRYFYTRAENKHDSSGLGLSIARELTLLHHGTIDFTSVEGKGTEFFVTLPLC